MVTSQKSDNVTVNEMLRPQEKQIREDVLEEELPLTYAFLEKDTGIAWSNLAR
jgi:hypothetical protein